MLQITEVIKHKLYTYRDACDEYETVCNIDFILSEPCEFEVYGTKYKLDRLKLTNGSWGEEIYIHFANETQRFDGIPVPKKFIRMVFQRVKKEQKDGVMQGYIFDDEFYDLLEKK